LIAASIAFVALVGGAFAFRLLPSKPAAKHNPSVAAPKDADGAGPWVDNTTTKPVATGARCGELQVESTPSGARVLLDGRESGFTPVTLKEVPAGRHALVLEGDGGTVRRTVRVQAGERTVASYEITSGFLSVISRLPVEVYLGSRKLGASGDTHMLLPPGQYGITLVNTRFRYKGEVEVTVRPGEVTTHTVQLPTGSLHVNTASGAEILVDGERVGTSPASSLSVAIGTRDVLVRHPQFGERRQSVEVVADRPVELSVPFDGATPRTPPRLAPLSMTPPPNRSR
jgi:hypothetical protein